MLPTAFAVDDFTTSGSQHTLRNVLHSWPLPEVRRFFTDDYARWTLDERENVEALEFCVDLIRKHGFVPPPESVNGDVLSPTCIVCHFEPSKRRT